MKKHPVIVEIISFLFILLFMYAASSKLLEYDKFKLQIGQSPLLTGFGAFVPWSVITVEVALSILLVFDRFRVLAFFGCFALMTMFTAYIIAILSFSSFIPCSCGGVLEDLTWTQHLVFNIAFVGLALAGIFLAAPDNRDPNQYAFSDVR